MTATRIEDLANVSTEHMLGLTTGLPLVKLRCESDGTVLIGQLSPDQARDIAMHLMESAARSEYEADFANEAARSEWTDEMVGGVLLMVREGETRRHTSTD